MAKTLVDSTGAASYLGVAKATLDKARSVGGEWPPYLKIGRRVMYDLADLDAWLEARRRRSTSDSGTSKL